MTSDTSEIVVRYTEPMEQADGSGSGGGVTSGDQSPHVDDSRFSGTESSGGAHRRISRSILDAIHSHGNPSSLPTNELGFKSQFHSNPLVEDPHILAMVEQLQAQGEVQSPEHHLTEAEDSLQGKGTSSSTSLQDHTAPQRAENPPTPPSTPLAATSVTEGIEYDYVY